MNNGKEPATETASARAARRGAWALAGLLALAAGCNRLSGPDGQIRIDTTPPGATVTCNGVLADQTPCTIGGLGPGNYVLVASEPGYRDARRSVALLENQRIAVELKLDPLTALVLVESKPSGAQVSVDGAFRGNTPFFMTDLPVGSHRFSFSSPGYLPMEIAQTLEDRVPRKLYAEMIANAGTVQVRSEPAGATVRLNGVDRGTTPCSFPDAPSGENVVEVSLPGYQTYTERFTIKAQETRDITANLQPIPTRLSIVSIPPGARIYVDDQYRGDAPIELTDLQPGSHRLRAELTGYETSARTVSLVKESTVVEEFRMLKNSGKLVIVTEPAGATVFVNGEEKGVTKPASDSDLVSAPLEVDLLPPGDYRVQLLRTGYAHAAKVVHVGPNQVIDVHEKMARRYIPDTRIHLKSSSGEFIRDGMLLHEYPNGDIELQLNTGTIMKIRAEDILSREPLQTGN